MPICLPSLRSRPAWARASFSAPSQASVPVLAEEGAIEAGPLGEAQRKLRLALVVVEVRGVDERAALAGDGFFNHRVVVAERVDADAAEQVEISSSVLVDDVNALAADKEDGVAVVGGKQQPGFGGANLIEFVQFHFSSGHHHFGAVGYAGAAQVGKEPAASAGKILTRFTPFNRASRQALSLGNMPPEMTALLAISAI